MIKLLTLTGPSGVGKTRIAQTLVRDYADIFCEAIAFTTRTPREGEIEGRDYYFMSRDDVESLEGAGKIFRKSDVHDNLYGHTKAEIERIGNTGKIGIVIPDLEGLKVYQQNRNENFRVVSGLVLPESHWSLGRRLEKRRVEGKFTEDTKERWKTGWEVFRDRGRQEGVYDFEVVHQQDKTKEAILFIIEQLQQRNFF